MTKRVLVTGSSGFVGSWLTTALNEKGFQVIKFDKQQNKYVNNWQQLKEIKNIDFVFHLASLSYIPYVKKNPRLTYETNTFGTLNVLELCRLNRAKLVFASSYLYGNPEYMPVDERHPIKLLNTYAKSKYLAEKLIKIYQKDYGLKSFVLRFFNIYGPGQRDCFLIPKIISQLKKDEIILYDPKPKRDYIFITDVVNAYLKAMMYNKSDLFNIGFGESFRVDAIVNKVIKLYGKSIKVKYLQKQRKNEIMDCIADIRKAKKELKWEPKISIENGLQKMINDYEQK